MTQAQLKKQFAAARRKFIEARFSSLNPVQRQAVLTTQGPLLIIAGAGSGKTTVLINRIANLLRYGSGSDSAEIPAHVGEEELEVLEAALERPEEYPQAHALCVMDPIKPWNIIAITFTNKAAGELKERLERMLGGEASDIWAMTFHSACARMLRRDADRLGFDRHFTIYDTSDSLSILKRIIREMDLDEKVYTPRGLMALMGKAKDARCPPREFLAQAQGDLRRRKMGEVYAEYTKRLEAANAMDFDDLIGHTVRLLEENEDIRSYYQKRFKYVMVDEYQDTNNLQYLLAGLLAGGSENICVVGDDDQSIYKFRGATIENILSFEQRYKNSRVIKLEQNYRSASHILNAANGVIRNNQGRKGKELWTENDPGDPVTLYVARDELDEARYVADQIMAAYARGENFRDNAVLYRMNAQSNQLEYAFKRSGIPYRIVGGTRFFDRAEVKDVLAYLCVILSPSDDLRLLRIINNPPRGIGKTTISLLEEEAATAGVSIWEVLTHISDYPALRKTAAKLCVFTDLMSGLMGALSDLPLDQLYDLVLDKTGYIAMLQSGNTEEDKNRAENVGELKSNILTYMKETGDESLAGFLDEVALYTDLDQYDPSQDSATLMTMHSAKGLEFPNVFVVGAEEGVFPGLRCIGEPDEMEEERRLCYVAMTRAKQRLTLTCAGRRMLFGRTSTNRPSRFIAEIPEENLVRKGQAAVSETADFRAPWETARPFGGKIPEKPRPVVPAWGSEVKAPTPAAAFTTGDAVLHSAFGRGEIAAMTPMGGDYLVEIAFEGQVRKRLMLRAAAPYMKKI